MALNNLRRAFYVSDESQHAVSMGISKARRRSQLLPWRPGVSRRKALKLYLIIIVISPVRPFGWAAVRHFRQISTIASLFARKILFKRCCLDVRSGPLRRRTGLSLSRSPSSSPMLKLVLKVVLIFAESFLVISISIAIMNLSSKFVWCKKIEF